MHAAPWLSAAWERRDEQKERHLQITRNELETAAGPADWFTGSVYIDTIAAPGEASPVGAAAVHFAPGARTA